ncbi:hypothetical protein ACQR1N_30905 [Bradyrhizobium sp. HKCCYLRH1073]|nr:hypothetical protein [Bradyrhizobium sp. SZCCHNS3052]
MATFEVVALRNAATRAGLTAADLTATQIVTAEVPQRPLRD